MIQNKFPLDKMTYHKNFIEEEVLLLF